MEMTMEKFVAYLKQLGFVYQGSEIYGGLANAWDYGPLGVELKNNIKKAWWKDFVQCHPNNVGIDAAILTKLDGDTRGGAALSIKSVVGKPIVFCGHGEKLDDLELF